MFSEKLLQDFIKHGPNLESIQQDEKLFQVMKDYLENQLTAQIQELKNHIQQLQGEIAQNAEEALRKSEARNRAMLNAIPDMMFCLNRDGIYLDFVAPKDAELLIPSDEIIGKSVQQILPPAIAEQNFYYTEQVLTTGHIQIFEYQLPIKGELRYYEARFVKSGDDEVLAIVRDISDRKRSEEALQALVASTAAVTGEEFFPTVVRYLAFALGVCYALVAEWDHNYPSKARVLAYWEGDHQGKNYEYDLTNTPCEIIYRDGGFYCSQGIQELFSHDRTLVTMGLQSYLGAPLLDAIGQPIGHLCVYDTKPILEEEHAKAILSIFAARASAELQRQRTENALRYSEKQYKELASREALLNRLARQIRASLDITTILETAVVEVRNLLQIDECNIAWYRNDVATPYWDIVQEARSSTAGYSLLNLHIPVAEGVTRVSGKIVNREIVRIDDTQAVPDLKERVFWQSLHSQSVVLLPIHTQSGEIKVLSCHNFSAPRHWHDHEVELLLAVADQIAIAVDQAELYKQSRITAQTAAAQATQLEETLRELQKTQTQLIQTEKMSSLGQLVAGIAHEINNPVNFIHGNINYANDYIQDLLRLVELYQQSYCPPLPEIQAEIDAIDLDFLCQDLPKLLASMKMGTDRIRQIVLSLRNFSRLDQADMKAVDIHEGIDNTLLLLQHRLKEQSRGWEIQVIKEYNDLPLVECYAGQLNQVFMNLLANAIDALQENMGQEESKIPTICIRTRILGDRVCIHIVDNGPGMTEEVRKSLFDPFFTTKPIGKGTGMGLSISYQIIVEKHYGQLECVSAPGQGAEFVVTIPLEQPAARASY